MPPKLFPLPLLIFACAGLGQSLPTPAPGNSRVYLLLKSTVAEAGSARDAFTQRMTALGAVNLQFVTGANAAKCEIPGSAQAAVAADVDVATVLPMDPAPSTTILPPAALPPPAPPPPMMTTPPYMPPPPSIPISAGAPMGGGISAGMALLTDFAGNVVVKLLSPGSSCKIRLRGSGKLPAAGGSGAFEVRASGNCAWQAVSTADWLHVKTEVNANGTTAVVYTATESTSGRRQAVVVIQPVAGMPPLKGHTVMVVGEQ